MSYSINIKFEISGESTPLNPQYYILPAATNPTTIEAGETAVLNFTADGMYFGFKSRKGASATGADLSWSSSGSGATITLSNPTSDVEVTILAVVNTAPQLVSKPFLYQLAAPVDTRLILSKKEMREMSDNFLPNIYFALCKNDGHFYLYNKDLEPNEETGKYRLIADSITYILEPDIEGKVAEAIEKENIDGKIATAIEQDNVIEAETYYDGEEVKAEVETTIDSRIATEEDLENLFK